MSDRLAHPVLLILLAVLAAAPARGQEGAAPARFETENGFHTLVIPIVEARKLQNEWSIVARGSLDGTVIALGVDLSLAPLKSKVDLPEVQVKLQGPEGQAFLSALAARTGVPLAGRTPRDETPFSLLVQSGSVARLESSLLDSTLMNMRDEGDYYGEWYLDIDLKRKVLTLSEKNEQYRAPLINSLTREGAPR